MNLLDDFKKKIKAINSEKMDEAVAGFHYYRFPFHSQDIEVSVNDHLIENFKMPHNKVIIEDKDGIVFFKDTIKAQKGLTQARSFILLFPGDERDVLTFGNIYGMHKDMQGMLGSGVLYKAIGYQDDQCFGMKNGFFEMLGDNLLFLAYERIKMLIFFRDHIDDYRFDFN